MHLHSTMIMTSTIVQKKWLSDEFIIAYLRAFLPSSRKVTFNKLCSKTKIRALNLGKILRASGVSGTKKTKVE